LWTTCEQKGIVPELAAAKMGAFNSPVLAGNNKSEVQT
jgi:hypothetical protein